MIRSFFLVTLISIATSLFAQKVVTLRIDPENARGGMASTVFEQVEFIPLESNKESLFGSIDQLEVTDSFFIVLDQSNRSVLLFKRDGSFHKRITSGGADNYFGYISVNHEDKEILITANFANAVMVYDFNANFLRKQAAPDRLSSLYYLSSGKLLFQPRRSLLKERPSNPYFDLVYTQNGETSGKYLNPYNPRFEDAQYNVSANSFNFSGEPGSCMFAIPFDYRVYQLNDTGISTLYKFVFPVQYSLPQNFAFDSSYYGKRAKYVYMEREHPKQIHGINHVFKYGDYLLFSAMNTEMKLFNDQNYLYNLLIGA